MSSTGYRRQKKDLDDSGFPMAAVANTVLLGVNEYGESGEDLEARWIAWMHNQPFDAPVTGRLAFELQERLDKFKAEDDPKQHHYLSRQLKMAQSRLERYTL